MVLKLRSIVTMAGIDQIFGQQDGRVVKAPSFRGERTKYTPDMRRFESCCQKKSIGWADGTEVTFRRYYGWHRPPVGGQQDGRVVKAPSFREERTKYTPDMRGIESCSQKKSIGWADGDEKHVPSLLWLA